MEFYIRKCRVRIEYAFILVLSFSVLLGANNILEVLLYSALHEAAHFIALVMFGGKAESLVFSFYGLALKYESRLQKWQEIIVIAAGPLTNLLLYFLLKNDVNLMLFFINALPVFPLDGGRILQLFSYRISKFVSGAMLVVLYVLALLLIVFCKSFSLFLITVYLTFYAIFY